MRASVFSALPLLLSGCVAVTTSGTEESLRFSGSLSPAENTDPVLKPYNDLPLSIAFVCPTRTATMMTSYVVPLPPVVPVGSVLEPVSYLRVRMPEGMESALPQTRIVTQQGAAVSLSDARPATRAAGKDGMVEATYAMRQECAAFNGALLQIAGFSYGNKRYPAAEARLRFDSKITGGVSWWPPVPFNGGRPLSDADSAASGPQAQ